MKRLIAIHLPQFHPIKENDDWWGKGFTEWTNVVSAKPLFKGHYQPHLPADLGFYDLRLEEARIAQEELAKQYGLYGFCYYHYWFNGKRLLHVPLDRKLKNPKEDLPFMLCWANENWTRRWDGLESDILIEQNYSDIDDLEHIRFLCQHFFSDPRYIRVNGKPFITIYRPSLIPNISKTLKLWREEARKSGIGELYIGFMNSFNEKFDINVYGHDVAIQFAPHFSIPNKKNASIFYKAYNYYFNLKKIFFFKLNNTRIEIKYHHFENFIFRLFYPVNKNHIFDYKELVKMQIAMDIQDRTFPSLIPMWDNSARKKGKNAHIVINNSPALYGKWLEAILIKFKPWSEEENFVFINAWNEWGEGNHLEPCSKWGKQYLEITKIVSEKKLNGDI